MPVLIPLFILIWVAVMVYIILKIVGEWSKNRNSPMIQREAFILDVFTREDTSMVPTGSDGSMMPVVNTQYYAKFQFADGSAEEFKLHAKEYKQLAAGMRGILTSQGTWFRGFAPF